MATAPGEQQDAPSRPATPARGDDLFAAWQARRGDFARDAAVSRSRGSWLLWVIIGAIFFAIGVVGIFLPVLPTTPFMIVAAGCWARSSPRLYNALLSSRGLGPVLYSWRESRTIPRRAKTIAIALIVVTFSLSIAFAVPVLAGQIAMAVFGAGVIVWLWRIPSVRTPPTRSSPDSCG